MNDRIRSRIQDTLEAALLVQEWSSKDSLEILTNDIKVESAYMHQFVLIGESLRIVRDLDPYFAETIPSVHQWIGLRHRLVHDYREIDLELLWTSSTTEIPSLIQSLNDLLNN